MPDVTKTKKKKAGKFELKSRELCRAILVI